MNGICQKSAAVLMIIVSFALLILFFSLNTLNVHAYSDEEMLSDQSEFVGVGKLFSSLPEQTKKELYDLGINTQDVTSTTKITLTDVFTSVMKSVSATLPEPLGAVSVCMGMLLLCALAQGMNITLGSRPLSGISAAVGSLCLCTVLCIPLCSLAEKCSELIEGACSFMLCYIPVLAGLLAFCCSSSAAASYYVSLNTAAEFASAISSKAVLPLTNTFLALSFGAALAPGMKLTPLFSAIYKLSVRILSFAMGIFAAVLSAQTLVSVSLDNVGKRALKFAAASFVPVVGSVLGETISAFGGSLELLRRGAGVLVLISSAALLLPLLVRCTVWQIMLYFLSASAQILSLDNMRSTIEAAASVVRMLTALLLCMLSLFIISTVTVILAGS